MDQLLSVEQAAVRLGGISKWTVHAWLSKGKIRRTKVGRRTMIRMCDLREFLDGCNPEPRAGEVGVGSRGLADCGSIARSLGGA